MLCKHTNDSCVNRDVIDKLQRQVSALENMIHKADIKSLIRKKERKVEVCGSAFTDPAVCTGCQYYRGGYCSEKG